MSKETRSTQTTEIKIKKVGRKWRATFDCYHPSRPLMKVETTVWADSEAQLQEKVDKLLNDYAINQHPQAMMVG